MRTTPRRLELAGYKFSHTFGYGLIFIKENQYHSFEYVNPKKGMIGWDHDIKKIILGHDINLKWVMSMPMKKVAEKC